jgi:hypothetical protein
MKGSLRRKARFRGVYSLRVIRNFSLALYFAYNILRSEPVLLGVILWVGMSNQNAAR